MCARCQRCRDRHAGVLKKGQLIEVTRKDLIGAHHGETAQLTSDAVKRALGGVLFIDEVRSRADTASCDAAHLTHPANI